MEESATVRLSLDDEVEEEILTQEELFSIPVVAETVTAYERDSSELEEELMVNSEEINNMEVVYELLEVDQQIEEIPVAEQEEEFIINDLDEEVLDLELKGSEEVVPEEENQFTFDFGLPITESHETPSEKIVHTLTEAEEEVNEDESLKEAVDFKFEVVEKPRETSVLDDDKNLSSPNDDSPFDQTIKETAVQENEKRKEHLKKFNHAFKHSMSKIDEFEKQPAYKRMGVELEEPNSSGSNESRMSVDNDNNDEIQLRSNNSFLHDNVD